MIALSLRQPWATAVLRLNKRIENRRWSTRVRGPFLIHAAKGMTLAELDSARTFCAAARAEETRHAVFEDYQPIDKAFFGQTAPLAWSPSAGRKWLALARQTMPFGAIVGIARLVDVVPPRPPPPRPEDAPRAAWYPQRARSAWRWHMPEQYGFVLEDVHELTTPIPYVGTLGFFDVAQEVVELAKSRLDARLWANTIGACR